MLHMLREDDGSNYCDGYTASAEDASHDAQNKGNATHHATRAKIASLLGATMGEDSLKWVCNACLAKLAEEHLSSD